VEGSLLCRKTPSRVPTAGSCFCGSLTRHRLSIGRTGRTSTWPSFPDRGPVCRAKGGSYHNQIMCDFTYAHRRIHDTEHAVIVTLHRDKTEQESGCQIQDLADKLAELVAQGKKLEFLYTFNNGQLIPCFRSRSSFHRFTRSGRSGRGFHGTRTSSNSDTSRK